MLSNLLHVGNGNRNQNGLVQRRPTRDNTIAEMFLILLETSMI